MNKHNGKDIFIYPLHYSTLFGGMYRPTTGSNILIRGYYLVVTTILAHTQKRHYETPYHFLAAEVYI